MLESCLAMQRDVEDLTLVGRMRKRNKKGHKKSKVDSIQGKRGLSNVKCFTFP
jgi:hypothetical protein